MSERTNEASKGGGAGPAKTKMAKEGRKQGAPGLKRRGFLGTEPGSGGRRGSLGTETWAESGLGGGARADPFEAGLGWGAVPGGVGGSGKAGIFEAGPPRVGSPVLEAEPWRRVSWRRDVSRGPEV